MGATERAYVFQLGPGGSVRVQRTFVSGFPSGNFTHSLTAIGDLDGDGLLEFAAGAPRMNLDTPGGRNEAGGLVIVFLNPNGTKRSALLVSEAQGGFTGYLPSYEHFGSALAWLGDLDGDGLGELAVGAPGEVLRTPLGSGSVWILSLAFDGTVLRELQIGYGLAGFTGPLDFEDLFGSGLANVGDLDADGRPELLVAAPGDDDGGAERGALWILFLDADGTVRSARKLSEEGGLGGRLQDGASLGRGMGLLIAFSGAEQATLFLGAPLDDRIARRAGTGWLLSLFAIGPQSP